MPTTLNPRAQITSTADATTFSRIKPKESAHRCRKQREIFTHSARASRSGTLLTWRAGAGLNSGIAYGESNELSWNAASNKINCYDLHSTILHEKLTFRHNGIDRRLTDVHGEVISDHLT